MKRLVISLVFLMPVASQAQSRAGFSPFIPTPPPRVTPYLGLIRGGNPAANYYLLVQPEVRRELDQRLVSPYASGDLIPAAPRREEDPLITVEPQSGHGAGFMLTNPYYTFPTRQRTYMPFGGQAPSPLPTPKGGEKK